MEERRLFLKRTGQLVIGLAGATTLLATKSEAAQTTGRPAMIIDVNRCTGCHSCVIACKEQNLTSHGNFNTRIETREAGEFPKACLAYTPELCHQCEDAPCIAACKAQATSSLSSGIVVTDWEKCIGDGACVDACPYGARFLDQENDNKSDKCDFCLSRLDLGLEPACVDTCPSKARIFGDLSQPEGEFAEYLRQHFAGDATTMKERVFHTAAKKIIKNS